MGRNHSVMISLLQQSRFKTAEVEFEELTFEFEQRGGSNSSAKAPRVLYMRPTGSVRAQPPSRDNKSVLG